jgi:hypothetical protein
MLVRACLRWVVQAGTRFWARSKWLWSFDRMTALTTALFAVLTFGVVVWFGVYPRPPVEAPLDPDTIYRDGAAIGHVSAFHVEMAGPAGEQYALQVEPLENIEKGDVLRFRHATCFVVDRRPGMLSAGDTTPFNVLCRVIGG